jgi:hypothetical protein
MKWTNPDAYMADLKGQSDEAFDTTMEDALSTMLLALIEYRNRNERDVAGHKAWGDLVQFAAWRFPEVLQQMGVPTDAFGKPAAERPAA